MMHDSNLQLKHNDINRTKNGKVTKAQSFEIYFPIH